MCYDSNALPPEGPRSGSASGEDIKLTSADGSQFAAYIAHATEPQEAQIIIYPDIRGLHQFYKDLALRFAEQGIDAIAIDYFGRTAPDDNRGDDFDFRAQLQYFQTPQFFADAGVARDYLRQGKGELRATFAVGFCYGGSLSILSSTQELDLSGVISFYGGLARELPGSGGTVLELASKAHVPVLGLYGGADGGIPVEQVEQLDKELDHTGITHEIVVYPDAPHSFFDRRQTEFADASTDAWKRVLEFIDRHSIPMVIGAM